MKLLEIAELVHGQCCGNPDTEITGAASIESAKSGEITFLLHAKYKDALSQTEASAVICDKKIDITFPCIQVEEPYLAMAALLQRFYPPETQAGAVHATACIGEGLHKGEGVTVHSHVTLGDSVTLGENTVLYPGVFVGNNVRIGASCVIHPNVSIYQGVSIGDHVVIHSGSVIGSDGFGYYRAKDGKFHKIPQVGGVTIEDGVEIGANVCVDRGTIGDTLLKKGAKIDNLVQIAHNVVIGEGAIVAGQSGVSGSSNVGAGVMMGGKVGIADHVTIEDGTMLAANSGVAGDLKRGIYSGSPAIPHGKWKRTQVALPKLPELIKKVRHLEKEVSELKK